MKILFNLLLLIPLLLELERTMSPVKACEIGKRFRLAKKANPDSYTETILAGSDGGTLKGYVAAYIVILLGLLSSQWVIFLVYMIFDILCNKLRVKRIAIGVFINALIGVFLITFAMINGLHLHYDIYHILISMF